MMRFTDKNLQTIISAVLRNGVWLVLLFASIGGVLYVLQHGHEPVNYSVFIEKEQTIGEIFSTVFNHIQLGEAEAIIFVSVLILFLTPLLRLLLSLVSFVLEKDYMYVVITLIVLSIISASVYIGISH